MTIKENEKQKEKRFLILCVDRDGDLGTKAGIVTPVIGRIENLDAAVKLALKDPEEPDANAIFEAVRLFDGLEKEKKTEEVFEVATISGSQLGGVGADRKIVSELNTILGEFSADEVILVTDGYTDEAVLPLVESRAYVSSVRRIVMKHSESIEETAALLSRYFKVITENPRYSRIALGLPGILFVIFGVLAIFDYVQYYLIAIIVSVGATMLIKGFGIDRLVKDIYRWISEYSPPPLQIQISTYAVIVGVLCVVISIYGGVSNAINNLIVVPTDPAGWLSVLPGIFGFFIKGAMDLIVVGIISILIGRTMKLYFDRDAKVLRNAALIISVAWSRFILESTANILINSEVGVDNLVWSIAVGILIGIASILIIVIVHRSYKSYFKKLDETVDKFGES